MIETESNTILLAVAEPARSAAFYARILAAEPVEESPGFALFILGPKLSLGLWRAEAVRPAPGAPGGSEIGFRLADAAAVDATHAEWVAAEAEIVLPPTDLDFGRSFVARDPDGYHLRVFALADG